MNPNIRLHKGIFLYVFVSWILLLVACIGLSITFSGSGTEAIIGVHNISATVCDVSETALTVEYDVNGENVKRVINVETPSDYKVGDTYTLCTDATETLMIVSYDNDINSSVFDLTTSVKSILTVYYVFSIIAVLISIIFFILSSKEVRSETNLECNVKVLSDSTIDTKDEMISNSDASIADEVEQQSGSDEIEDEPSLFD